MAEPGVAGPVAAAPTGERERRAARHRSPGCGCDFQLSAAGVVDRLTKLLPFLER